MTRPAAFPPTSGPDARRRPPGVETALLALPAVLGTMALLAATRSGAYTSPDSAFYVGVARNLADGHGLASPPGSVTLSHFPPMFPIVLAVAGRLGFDPLDATAWINPLLLGVTAMLAAVVVRRRTGSPWAGALTALSLVVSRDLLTYHGAALSEPLFITLTLGGLIALDRYLASRDTRWLVAAAGLAAAGTITRYAGLALVACGVVGVAWPGIVVGSGVQGPAGRANRGRAVASYAAVAVIPLVVWMVWAGPTDRSFVWHPMGAAYLRAAARGGSTWLAPASISWPGRGLLAALVLTVAVVMIRLALRGVGLRSRVPVEAPRVPGVAGDGDAFLRLLGLFAVMYLGLLVVQRVFLDASSSLDLRLLMPLHVIAIVAVALVLTPLIQTTRSAAIGRVLLATVVVLISVHTAGSISWLVAGNSDRSVARRGLTALAWERSAVMAAISAVPPGVVVYSNAPDAVYLLTGRATRPLPARVDYLTARSEPLFESAMAVIATAAHEDHAVIAWFRAATWRARFLPTEGELVDRFDMTPVATDAVGTLYRTAGR